MTGGATSADGTVVALRTYTDAYLYPAPDGDVAAALRRDPVRIPLPDEKQGEAIAFDPDGTLLSASEGTGQPVRALRNAAALVSPQSPGSPSAGAESGADSGAAQDNGGVPILPAAGIAVAVVLAGWFLLSRLRRR